MELSPEFHGDFWTTFEQHLWFHGIAWNSIDFCPDPKFHGIPWNFFHTPEFHGIPWHLINFIFKKIIFLNIVFGIWLMIRCYLAKISQKRYILHWFQYRNNTPVSAKMAQGQRKWRAVYSRRLIDMFIIKVHPARLIHVVCFRKQNPWITTTTTVYGYSCRENETFFSRGHVISVRLARTWDISYCDFSDWCT